MPKRWTLRECAAELGVGYSTLAAKRAKGIFQESEEHGFDPGAIKAALEAAGTWPLRKGNRESREEKKRPGKPVKKDRTGGARAKDTEPTSDIATKALEAARVASLRELVNAAQKALEKGDLVALGEVCRAAAELADPWEE